MGLIKQALGFLKKIGHKRVSRRSGIFLGNFPPPYLTLTLAIFHGMTNIVNDSLYGTRRTAEPHVLRVPTGP